MCRAAGRWDVAPRGPALKKSCGVITSSAAPPPAAPSALQFTTGTMRSDRPPNCLFPKSRIARSITLGSHDISVGISRTNTGEEGH